MKRIPKNLLLALWNYLKEELLKEIKGNLEAHKERIDQMKKMRYEN